LAFGANTPLEHLFNSIPLYGQQRLQSRNMIDVSVAVTVLFAGWLDRRTDAGKTCGRFDRWVGFVPLGVVLALAIWAIADPRSLITTLTTASGSPGEIHTVREASSIALAFCLTAGVIVWLRAKLRGGLWMAAVTVFMLIDLGLIAGTSQLIVAPSNALLSGHTPVENYLASHLAPGGRYDVYDPLGYSSGLSELDNGLPDDNVLALLPSVGGYASIVSGEYDARTLTHAQGDLNVPLIGSDAFRELDLQDIVTAPEYFLVPLEKAPTGLGKVSPVSEHQGVDPVLPMGSRAVISGSGYADSPAPRGSLASGQTSRWFFGRSLHPTRASVLLTRSATAAQVRFGTVTQKGTTRWSSPVSVDRGTRRVVAPLPAGKAVGLAVQVLKGRLPAHQAVVVAGARDYELDGSLSSAVQPGVWSQATSIGGYTVFDRTRPPAPIHAERSPGQPGALVTVLSNGDNGETVQVRTTEPVVVVRDVAWDGGWHASDSTNGAPPRAVAVNRHNLVQQVRLPVGNDVVTFAYQPRHWLVASLLSAVGVGQGEEELPFVGAPHAVDHEARGTQLVLDPLRCELGADLGQQVLALSKWTEIPASRSVTSVASSARSRISIHCSSSFHRATWVNRSGSKSPPSCSLSTWRTFLLNCRRHAGGVVVGRHQALPVLDQVGAEEQ
jgi:hypothetical protein